MKVFYVLGGYYFIGIGNIVVFFTTYRTCLVVGDYKDACYFYILY